MEKLFVAEDEISDKFRSKKDIYDALKYQRINLKSSYIL